MRCPPRSPPPGSRSSAGRRRGGVNAGDEARRRPGPRTDDLHRSQPGHIRSLSGIQEAERSERVRGIIVMRWLHVLLAACLLAVPLQAAVASPTDAPDADETRRGSPYAKLAMGLVMVACGGYVMAHAADDNGRFCPVAGCRNTRGPMLAHLATGIVLVAGGVHLLHTGAHELRPPELEAEQLRAAVRAAQAARDTSRKDTRISPRRLRLATPQRASPRLLVGDSRQR
jgi:hypothetical protein